MIRLYWVALKSIWIKEVTRFGRIWVQTLADVAAAVAQEKGVASPVQGTVNVTALAIARSMLGGERKAVLLGNAAAHHARASSLLALANWIAEQTGASVGYLTEAANTVGAQLAGAVPGPDGLNAAQMLSGALKAAVLLNCEPAFDSAAGPEAASGLRSADMVVSLSPFKANMDVADVLLPIAPFTETSGTFVNAEGRVQSFHAVVRAMGEARPAWKVLRVLGDLMGLNAGAFDSTRDVLAAVPGLQGDDEGVTVQTGLLDNRTQAAIDITPVSTAPVVASIYQLDGLVRRSASLQSTTDGRLGSAAQEVAA